MALRRQGKLTEARSHHEEALDIYRRQGNRSGLAHTLCQLGWVVDQAGDHRAARRCFSEGLEHAADSRDPMAVAVALEGVASLVLAGAEGVVAATLLGAAAGLRSATGTALSARDQEDVSRLERSAEEAAGPAYRESYETGRGLDMAAAVHAGRDAVRAADG